MLKAGDKVDMFDRSWAFGIENGEYTSYVPMKNLIIVQINLNVMEDASGQNSGQFSEVCDLLVTNGIGDFYFVPSRFCKPVNKKIEIRYFSDGKDMTDQISDETKRNLKTL